MPLPLAEVNFFYFHITAWMLVGFAGTAAFGSRFFVQWLASEKRKVSYIPVSFWWLSIIGSILQAIYFGFKANPATGAPDPDLVGLVSTLPNSAIYIRNLQLLRKQKLAAEAARGTNKDTHAEHPDPSP